MNTPFPQVTADPPNINWSINDLLILIFAHYEKTRHQAYSEGIFETTYLYNLFENYESIIRLSLANVNADSFDPKTFESALQDASILFKKEEEQFEKVLGQLETNALHQHFKSKIDKLCWKYSEYTEDGTTIGLIQPPSLQKDRAWEWIDGKYRYRAFYYRIQQQIFGTSAKYEQQVSTAEGFPFPIEIEPDVLVDSKSVFDLLVSWNTPEIHFVSKHKRHTDHYEAINFTFRDVSPVKVLHIDEILALFSTEKERLMIRKALPLFCSDLSKPDDFELMYRRIIKTGDHYIIPTHWLDQMEHHYSLFNSFFHYCNLQSDEGLTKDLRRFYNEQIKRLADEREKEITTLFDNAHVRGNSDFETRQGLPYPDWNNDDTSGHGSDIDTVVWSGADKTLFLLELKINYSRSSIDEITGYTKGALQKAAKQLQRHELFIESCFAEFKQIMADSGIALDATSHNEIRVKSFIVSNTFEHDHVPINGYDKVSLFDLKVLLTNTKFDFFDAPEDAVQKGVTLNLWRTAFDRCTAADVIECFEQNWIWGDMDKVYPDLNFGEAYGHTGRIQLANNFVLDVREPYYAAVHRAEGIKEQKKGRFKAAVVLLDKSIAIFPSAEAYKVRGNCHAELDEVEKSIEDCLAAIELDPADADNYGNLAHSYLLQKDLNQMLHYAELALELAPYNGQYYRMVAPCKEQLKKGDEVENATALLNVLTLEPNSKSSMLLALKESKKLLGASTT
jgi:tetratricopeptide (TPR) repeat protein